MSAGVKSEDVLLLVKWVRHKKVDGELMIMTSRIAFSGNANRILSSHRYEDIKQQKISPEGKAKIQLQLALHSGDAITFQFTNPNGVDYQKTDRNSVKEMLQELLPTFRRRLGKDMEIKQKILTEDSRLYQLYIDLVTTNVITAEEYWSKIAADRFQEALAEEEGGSGSSITTVPTPGPSTSATATGGIPSSPAKQPIGVSSAFMAEVRHDTVSTTEKSSKVQYRITTDIIDAIFRTYPAVKKKHRDSVPAQMTESEFWSQFFQSRYFHRDRDLGEAASSKDMFSDCALKDLERLQDRLKKGVKDPTVDVTNFDDEDYFHSKSSKTDQDQSSKDSKDSKKFSGINANQTLIKRCNHHSIMVLESCLGSDSPLPPIIPGSNNPTTGIPGQPSIASLFPALAANGGGTATTNGPASTSLLNGTAAGAGDEFDNEKDPDKKKKKKKKKNKEKDKEKEKPEVTNGPTSTSTAVPEDSQQADKLKAAQAFHAHLIEEDERRRVKRARLEEETTYDDLEDEETSAGATAESEMDPERPSTSSGITFDPAFGQVRSNKQLKISNKDRYLFGPTPQLSTLGTFGMNSSDSMIAKIFSSSASGRPLDVVRNFSKRQTDFLGTSWNPHSSLSEVIGSSAAVKALTELSPGGEYMKIHSVGGSAGGGGAGCKTMYDQLSSELQTDLLALYRGSSELLRHFWACFPVTSPALDEKLTRMSGALERFQTAKLAPFMEKMQTQHVQYQLLAHIQGQIKIAMQKYQAWQNKRASRK